MEGKSVGVLKAHVALYVGDVGRSIEFYRKMLGLEPCKVRRGYAKFDVQEPPLNLTLNERAGAVRGTLSHLGIQVASTADVLALRERWRAAGLGTFDEVQTICCYADSATIATGSTPHDRDAGITATTSGREFRRTRTGRRSSST